MTTEGNIQNTQQNIDFNGPSWVNRQFSHPERTIRLGTSFSGIGAIEYAFKRLGLNSRIMFAGDIDANCKKTYFANYDIEEASGVETSANYLGNMTLKAAGIPLTGYRAFLDDFSKKCPVVTAIHAVSENGTDTSISDAGNALDDYRKMQYYELFDDHDDFE